MFDFWDINSRVLITFFLAMIAFVVVWKWLGPPAQQVDKKRGKAV